MNKKLLFTVITLATGSAVVAQDKNQKDGNIVEYFGKERVETVKEGTVVYHFEKGFFLTKSTTSDALFPTGDQLAWEIYNESFKAPSDNNLSAPFYGETKLTTNWTPITANEEGMFRDRGLRGAFLYSEYNSPKQQTLILQAAGGTRTLINGMPHEGDHYDFAYTLIPFTAKKGINNFVFTPGRFGKIDAQLIEARKPVMLIDQDMTMGDIIVGEKDEKWAAVRVLNASSKALKGMTITASLPTGESATYATEDVIDMTARKLPFLVPTVAQSNSEKAEMTITLKDARGKVIDEMKAEIRITDGKTVHERTFRSRVDQSVQYYSVQPSTKQGKGQALFLSVHGASVEARNQARAYAQKDWGYLVAATNRRPFGFNWEEWGRIDAMEVYEEAKRVFETDPYKSYLTGHSMGGHGTWYLGVTYPDRFAAIAPCASYPDIIGYGRGKTNDLNASYAPYSIIKQSANAGRTLSLKENYLQQGVYVFHGDADNVVPVEQARQMRKELSDFHPNFCYYEYPGGSHWFGNHSVDWKPIFEFFDRHQLPESNNVKHINFTTASPAISASNHWVTISQQDKSYDFSNLTLDANTDSIYGKTENVAALKIDFSKTPVTSENATIVLDGQTISVSAKGVKTLQKSSGQWKEIEALNTNEKHELRFGGFKQAFDNDVVLVYATAGNKEENEWYKNKARFDGETFLYRGNGSLDIVSDKEFIKGGFDNRNVVIYGNASNNRAWKQLLSNAPIQVDNKQITLGEKIYTGDDFGTYFVCPRPGTSNNLVGVVAGTGIKGAQATYPNNYISGISGYPDAIIFNLDVLSKSAGGIKAAGFFGNDWKIDTGNFKITN